MKLPEISFEFLRTIPIVQKVLVLILLMVGIPAIFFYTIWDEKNIAIQTLEGEIVKQDTEIQALTVKAKHLEELIAANKQLELALAKKKESLPPEEEAVLLLKQLSEHPALEAGNAGGRRLEALREASLQRGAGRRISYGSAFFRSDQ